MGSVMNDCQLLVVGSAEPIDRNKFLLAMNGAINQLPNARIILRDGNGQVDSLIRSYVEARRLPYEMLRADWQHQGNVAGLARNHHMALYATHALIFWNGWGRDIKHLIDECKRNGVKCHIVVYET